jgi:pyruvate,water dikinase
MIGWRGASRYYDPRFKEAFGLECEALKKVREEFGLTNVTPMIPFCRTPEEGRKVIQTMSEFGLKQGESGLKIYAMAEIPANMILADEFLDIFDGFSIGSNDLTQLTVGIDRDNTELAKIADERNEAVKISVGKIIEVAKKKGKYVGICGQAPSDYEDFATFLVEKGIESISLNPDSVVKTAVAIKKKEEQLHG